MSDAPLPIDMIWMCGLTFAMLERLAKGEDNLEELLTDVWKVKRLQHMRDFRPGERQQRAAERLSAPLRSKESPPSSLPTALSLGKSSG